MNYNQQVRGYKCDDCLKTFLASEVKQYCLDNNQGVKVYCLLCPACSYTQVSSREKTGVFSLLAFTRPKNTTTIQKEIKTPEFIKYGEEMKAQQDYQQQFKSLFNCDKCSKPISIGEEKEHCFTKYFENTSTISDMKWHLFCPLCYSGFTKDLGKTTIDLGKTKNIETTPTFERYQEHKERFKEIKGETWREYLERELERQEQLKLGY